MTQIDWLHCLHVYFHPRPPNSYKLIYTLVVISFLVAIPYTKLVPYLGVYWVMIETCPPSLVSVYIDFLEMTCCLIQHNRSIVSVYSLTEAAINKYTNMVVFVRKMLHSQNDDISHYIIKSTTSHVVMWCMTTLPVLIQRMQQSSGCKTFTCSGRLVQFTQGQCKHY